VRSLKVSGRYVQGFSLVELMVVVAIIGILASLAIPKFRKFTMRAKQAEAKNALHHIYALQEGYQTVKSTYGEITDIGWEVSGEARYVYSVTGISATTFVADATAAAGVICSEDDIWGVDQTNVLNPLQDCTDPIVTP
jgi:prepilin-type N-terminal cleavage/methylation domain-containing protein